MNTIAADVDLPQPRLQLWHHIRGLYSGAGYVAALGLCLTLWWTTQAMLPRLLSQGAHGFFRDYAIAEFWNFTATLPGPLLVTVIVNLAPRTGLMRIVWLFAAIVPMSWWCLVVIEGVRFGWNWNSLGYALDGFLTTSLIVGVCAYHRYSKNAADALMRTRIERTSLDAELQRAHLRLLRAQIEPHFLFNTLAVVHALAKSDRAATVEVLDNLIRYFEAALPQLRRNEVPLAQEFELIHAYLAIYRARMGTRLTYELHLPRPLRHQRVPPMMLLTLVENALKHGICRKLEGGHIEVSAERSADCLLLKVVDSGQGLDLKHGYGTGLANIGQRLSMLYGSRAALTLSAANPRGVVAGISIPMAGGA